jgi:hypothetical protein
MGASSRQRLTSRDDNQLAKLQAAFAKADRWA